MTRTVAYAALTAAAVAIGFRTDVSSAGAGTPAAIPPALVAYLTSEAHLAASDRSALLAGRAVAAARDATAADEVGVVGAIWIEASSASYVQAIKDIEGFERGSAFPVTKRIGDPPAAEDFDALDLSDHDLDDLRDCRVGDCQVKLGARALTMMHTQVDWQNPSARDEANATFRRFAFEYVTGYREGGNARLAVYRDKKQPMSVADEFRSMVDRLAPLAVELPDVKRYLLEYPRVTLPNAVDFLYWQKAEFGLKPTIRISHLVIQERPERTIVASKMLYASHYFRTALELRLLLRDPARPSGFWLVTVNTSRSDGLKGLMGPFIRARVRSEARRGTLAALMAAKSKLEAIER